MVTSFLRKSSKRRAVYDNNTGFLVPGGPHTVRYLGWYDHDGPRAKGLRRIISDSDLPVALHNIINLVGRSMTMGIG